MIEIKKNIFWLGVKDPGLRVFHGHELSTLRGTSFNSYLIKDEKTVLVDTVWKPFRDELSQIIDNSAISKLDMLIVNHMEPDHGGSVGLIAEMFPGIEIYCTKNGAEIIKKYTVKDDLNFKIVKTGDVVKTGEYELVFVEMQMIHWPDSMATYVKGADLLLSNDGFGQHFTSSSIYADEVDSCELWQESLKYFVNILNPFTALIKKKIDQIKALNLPIDMIAPSHGVIWRKDPMRIVDMYYKWADNYSENYVVITYDTMYESTRLMAQAISEGLLQEGVCSKLFNLPVTDKSDLNVEIFKSKALIVGCCTVNNGVLRDTAALLEEVRYLKLKNKLGAGYTSYGWSGEAGKIISAKLKEAGFDVFLEPVTAKFKPDNTDVKKCMDFGREIGKKLKNKEN